MGYTLQSPEKDKNLYSRQELLSKLVIYMGGRVAEQIVFEDFTTGAADDLQRASELAHRMVFRLGMSDRVGPLSYVKRERSFVGKQTTALSSDTFEMLDHEVRHLILQSQQKALQILELNIEVLHDMSQKLLEEETLRGDALSVYLQKVTHPTLLLEKND